MNPYEQQLEDLKSGKIDEIKVDRDQFFLFREAWRVREDKKYFVGTAAHGGKVTYRYDETVL